MNMYGQPQFSQQMTTSPMHPGMSQNANGPQRAPSSQDPGGGGSGGGGGGMSVRSNDTPSAPRNLSRSHSMHQSASASPHHSQSKTPRSTSFNHGQSQPQNQNLGGTPNSQTNVQQNSRQSYTQPKPPHLNDPRHQENYHQERQHNDQYGRGGFQGQPQNPQPGSKQDRGMGQSGDANDGLNGPLPIDIRNYNPNNQGFSWEPMEGGWPSTMVGRPHMQSAYKNAYSSTGFDMLGVLVCGVITFPAGWCANDL